jgi:hypothetical protein
MLSEKSRASCAMSIYLTAKDIRPACWPLDDIYLDADNKQYLHANATYFYDGVGILFRTDLTNALAKYKEIGTDIILGYFTVYNMKHQKKIQKFKHIIINSLKDEEHIINGKLLGYYPVDLEKIGLYHALYIVEYNMKFNTTFKYTDNKKSLKFAKPFTVEFLDHWIPHEEMSDEIIMTFIKKLKKIKAIFRDSNIDISFNITTN